MNANTEEGYNQNYIYMIRVLHLYSSFFLPPNIPISSLWARSTPYPSLIISPRYPRNFTSITINHQLMCCR